MHDRNPPVDQQAHAESDVHDELRTISFRLREIQRLLGARVEQENRRLQAEGIAPVTDRDSFRTEEAETRR